MADLIFKESQTRSPLSLVRSGGTNQYLDSQLQRLLIGLLFVIVINVGMILLAPYLSLSSDFLTSQLIGLGAYSAICLLGIYLSKTGNSFMMLLLVASASIAGVLVGAFISPFNGPVNIAASLLMISVAVLSLPPVRFRLLIRIFGWFTGFHGIVYIYRFNLRPQQGIYHALDALAASLLFVLVLFMLLVQLRNLQNWLTESLFNEIESSNALKHTQRNLENLVRERTSELNAKVEELQLAQIRLKMLESVAIYAREAIAVIEAYPTEANSGRKILFINKAFTDMFGYSAEEVSDKTLNILRAEVSAPEVIAEVNKSMDEGKPVRAELPNHHKNGNLVWGDTEYSPVYEEDKLTHWTWITRDNTVRRQAQLELREQRDFALQVMRSMLQMVVIISVPERKIEYVNPAAQRMVSKSEAEIVGNMADEFLPNELVKLIGNPNSHHMRGLTHTYESDLLFAGNEKRRMLIHSAPRWKNGVVNGVIAVITDLTEQRQIEEALREARDRAVEASQLKSQFLATMSHEIRTPMNAMLGMSELLLDTDLEEEQRDMASVINESSHLLMSLLNDVLEFSKIEARRVELDIHPIDTLAQFNNTIDLFSARAIEHGLSLRRNITAELLPKKVFADGEKIRRVLSNLLSNAIKFTLRGYVQVSINSFTKDESTWLHYSVKDTGIGITPSAASMLFEPFRQGDNSTTRKYGGTGLGLSISRDLVRLMKGDIGFKSEAGAGSEFWFDIPVDTSLPELEPQLRDQ